MAYFDVALLTERVHAVYVRTIGFRLYEHVGIQIVLHNWNSKVHWFLLWWNSIYLNEIFLFEILAKI